MGFLWVWVPHRKERKELDRAIKPANRQERKALARFGKTASAILLRETGIVKSEHSLEQLKGRILEFRPPERPKMIILSANLTPFVPPGLKLEDNLFPSLAAVLIMAGMKNYDRQLMNLQVDYNQFTGKLSVEIPSTVPREVLEARMVKDAARALSADVEHIAHIGNTRLTLHARRA